MKAQRALRLFPVLVLALAGTPAIANNLITNGDFQTGDLSGWTVVMTANGTAGSGLPVVSLFDTTGGGATYAAQFEVGEATYSGEYEGAGLSQTIDASGAGLSTYVVDFAAVGANGNSNNDSGQFELFVNGFPVASEDFGPIGSAIDRDSFTGPIALNAGENTVEILIERPYTTVSDVTPYEYLDNISFTDPGPGNMGPGLGNVVPEPTTLLLAGSGLAALAAGRRKRRPA